MTPPQEHPHPTPGSDTPTGTDPDARYTEPGYQDVSLGQAVQRDTELAEELLAEEHGDERAAERRFDEEATGAPRLAEQRDEHERPGR